MENLRTEFPKRGVNLNYTLSNRYDGTGVFFKKKGVSLIIRRLSFNSNTNFLFSNFQFSKDDEWLQSNK